MYQHAYIGPHITSRLGLAFCENAQVQTVRTCDLLSGDEGEINPIAVARASLKRRQPKAKFPEASDPIAEDAGDTEVSKLRPSKLMRRQTSGPTAQAAPFWPQVRRSVRIDSLYTAARTRSGSTAFTQPPELYLSTGWPRPKKETKPAKRESEVEASKPAEAPAEMGGVKLRTSPSRTR
eukprot:TRINITY_DN12644_c3_g2_i2.p1 TRINITY_DN12644_c3_g2~~TRINITY_DN12644_c3_g2_i2.p1  ORF type:complete len:179 (+),score=11.54 TRINITY_DN12644_c3_g2_i2:422-958(+)